MKLDGEVKELRQWDALRVAPPVARQLRRRPDGMEFLVFGFGEGSDSEMLQGYWDES